MPQCVCSFIYFLLGGLNCWLEWLSGWLGYCCCFSVFLSLPASLPACCLPALLLLSAAKFLLCVVAAAAAAAAAIVLLSLDWGEKKIF